MKSDKKTNCYYVDEDSQAIQFFGSRIWIDHTSKHIYFHDSLIYSLPEGDEAFTELVIGHRCIYGVTQNASYVVFENNNITEFNRNNATDPRDWD